MTKHRKAIQLIYFDAGGGHRAAAHALAAQAQREHRPWDVELVNLSKVLQPDGTFKRLTGIEPEDLYNLRLKRGWTWGMSHELRVLQAVIRLLHPSLLRQLQVHWANTEPDLVVSLVPNFNRALGESLASTLPGVPFMTVLTDLADCPPNFWIEPGLAQHVVCGSSRAYEQAQAMGYGPDDLTLASGMILRSDFYEPAPTDRDALRRAIGLHPSRPTGFVMFGGYGSNQMLQIARQLWDMPLVMVCGHNDQLVRRLRDQRAALGAKHVVLGFTPKVRHYMDLCDFFVGKPGPGSLSEAIQRGLPAITVIDATTLPQERFNGAWLEERQAGMVLASTHELRGAVDRMILNLPTYQANLRSMSNRAVFEVIEVMATHMARSEAASKTLSDGFTDVRRAATRPTPVAMV